MNSNGDTPGLIGQAYGTFGRSFQVFNSTPQDMYCAYLIGESRL